MFSATMFLFKSFVSSMLLTIVFRYCVAYPIQSTILLSAAPGQAPANQPIADQPPVDQNLGQAPVGPPTQAPVGLPTQAPVGQPTQAPSSNLPHRSSVAVQGVVYCKSCKYQGINTLSDASPLPGATVTLRCNNSRRPLSLAGRTDQNGYFLIQAPNKVSTYGAHKCRVFLGESPSNACNKHTNLHSGYNGAFLKLHSPPSEQIPFTLYSVGPFAFEPTSCRQ